MSRSSNPKRGRGRPRREYRIRVRGERRERPDYDKLARALLEHAAMEEARKRGNNTPDSEGAGSATTDTGTTTKPDGDADD